jgi:hypothetical protein
MGFIVTVRGTLRSADGQAARKAHDSAAAQVRTLGKTMGNLHHQPYLNPENPRELIEGMPEIKVFEDKGWLSW